MSRARVVAALIVAATPATAAAQESANPAPGVLQTRAERTAYVETSRYEDVMTFLAALNAAAPTIDIAAFGYSMEGRALPVARWGLGPTRVFVLADIHAGEVAGKEAALIVLRDLAAGAHGDWADSLTVWVAPIYNADGNERVALTHRRGQHGPIGGMGQRFNAQGYDLNRDFMKLEAPESRSLVSLFAEIDPHIVIDLHTTNGTIHGYHLTYAPPLHPNSDAAIEEFLRDSLFPSVTAAMRPDWDAYYYGNLPGDESVEAERAWYTFDHRPRFSTNYVGLRNRMGILSEAYAYLSFSERIAVTGRFVEEILRYAYEHATEIRDRTESADRRSQVEETLGLRATWMRTGDEVEILLGEVVEERNPFTGQVMLRRLDVQRPLRMPEFGAFRSTETERVPLAYLIPPTLVQALERVAAHGIELSALDRSIEITVEEFRITESSPDEREFQGHRQRTVEGRYEQRRMVVPAGTVVIPTAQPLGRLVFSLLEPRSDDGLLNWNVLDDAVEGADRYPIVRTFEEWK